MKKIFIQTEYKFLRKKTQCLKENWRNYKVNHKTGIIMMKKRRELNSL